MALSLALAFGVLRVTMQAMSAAAAPATTRTDLAAAGAPRLR
jgi:hypothetical protein